jgi:hypothetical protein
MRLIFLSVIGLILGTATAAPPAAAQNFWWGSPVRPGFDPNTVIQVTGTAAQVDIARRSGHSSLSLESTTERFAVMLGPGWYLSEQHADIQDGDSLVVEGSKMMDSRGHLHLLAARVINQRTGAVLELRDETGRPRWAAGGPPWRH